MNALHQLSATLLALAVSCAPLAAQTPVKPPPWWRVNDDVTVSLFFEFNPGALATPTIAVVPSWYNTTQTTVTPSLNLQALPVLTSHTNVLALVGNGTPQTAALEIKVDNDPHVDWIKIFWFQYDEFKGSSGSLASSIRKELTKYGRATVTEEARDALGAGWEKVTISAKLIPQPDDEKMDWAFTETAFGTEAIDNLFVNSKCVKPGDDEKGKALGKDEGTAVNLFSQTGGKDCVAAAITEGPAPGFAKTYWVGARISGGQHEVIRLNQAGTLVGTTPLPVSSLQAPLGPMDLAVERLPVPGQYFVYAIVDRRASGGSVEIQKLDASGGLFPATALTTFPPLPPQQLGLAFDPSGDTGNGTFWISGELTNVTYEFSRTGVLLDTKTISVSVPGAGFAGLGYDDKFGQFYGWSPTARPSPFGPLRVNGFEWSGYDFTATGSEFLGNLNVSPGPPNRGGVATGLEVYRSGAGGEFRFVCVVRDNAPGNPAMLYELDGPYRFGWSQLGTCGMQGGPPFEGGTTFAVTLRGVPNSVAAILYAGLSNTTSSGTPLPAPLAFLGPGFDESFLSISPDVVIGSFAPITTGGFVAPILLPPAGGLSYVPLYFQWLVLDTSVPGLIAMSQAGKTVAY